MENDTASSFEVVTNLRIPLRRVELHGVSIGSGPLALLFHGISANAYVFLPLMQLLASGFRLVSVDLRGHGRSGKPPSGYTATDYADDIRELIEHFGAGKALLIGHALGARNALVAAARFTELISAVIAIEFTPFIEPAVFDALESRVIGGVRKYESKAEIEQALAHRYPLLPAEAIRRRAEFGFIQVADGFVPLADPSALRETCVGMREDLAPVFSKVGVPTLLIRGVESRFVSTAAWTATTNLRRDIARVEIKGADHYVSEEAYVELADVITRFLKDANEF